MQLSTVLLLFNSLGLSPPWTDQLNNLGPHVTLASRNVHI